MQNVIEIKLHISGRPFLTTSLVFFTEVLKYIICLLVFWGQARSEYSSLNRMMDWKMGVLRSKNWKKSPNANFLRNFLIKTNIFLPNFLLNIHPWDQGNFSLTSLCQSFKQEVINRSKDTSMLGLTKYIFIENNKKISAVPACAYIVQNNLLIFALTILDAATYQA